ncbi:hypothetical protein [Bacillus kwashiorkori]|uniref:hypothetical protein n=1 Tax=Bacillus kwashiorkori TaxID=1522318 RepID=UPI00078551DF|nr:hypothetical protein [Bacillus kwashiorkori]
MQQQNTTQSSQNVMPQPPNIVTVKDSLYLTDMLSWNLLAMKKAHFFSGQVQDPEIKSALEKTGKMHQRHYQTILSHLNKQGTTEPPKMM